MKNRGIGATVVIAVIVIITIGVGGYFIISGGGEGGTELPVYPGASKVDIPSQYESILSGMGVSGKAYDVEASVEKVASWYEDNMSAQGWNKMGEYVEENRLITIGWKKEGEGAGIQISTKEAQAMKDYAALFEDNILHLYTGSPNKIDDLLMLPGEPKGIVSSFASPGPAPEGLAWDGEHLWNADHNSNKIYELDTEGNIISSFESPCAASEGLAWDGTHLWLAYSEAFENGKLYKINPDTENVVKSIKIPVKEPTGLAWDGEQFWVNNAKTIDEKICQLDTSGNLISSFDSPSGAVSLSGLAWDGNYLRLTGMSAKIYKIDTSGNVISSFDAPSSFPTGLAWDGEHLWNADSEEKIYEINPSAYKK